MKKKVIIEGNIVDVIHRTITKGRLHIEGGRIISVEASDVPGDQYIFPGFIDAHVHIESSMVVPSSFAATAVYHGTTATVSDPHEIANVLGVEGVRFMIENGNTTPFKFNFGAPSCVPATPFETSGAAIDAAETASLLATPEVKYLAEMMNFPGVINNDEMVAAKLAAAKQFNKPVDGHAPGLRGALLKKYVDAGISTDHECFDLEEAIEKASLGMQILIREGSAAKNFNDLIPLLNICPGQVMFCSDDKHPDDLLKGHINLLIKRALKLGYDFFDTISAATLNPVKHYHLDSGLLQPGDYADVVVVDNLSNFNILQTWINGEMVFDGLQSLMHIPTFDPVNLFHPAGIVKEDFRVPAENSMLQKVKVIGAVDGQLITEALSASLPVRNGAVHADIENDILKIVVINRYRKAAPAIGFIKGFGLKNGAMASTVAHDSHNMVIVGADDDAITKAAQLLEENRGGLAVVTDETKYAVPLPVAGIMSHLSTKEVAQQYAKAEIMVKKLGSRLNSPFMTLSFMALLVIPSLKLGDKGLFDVNNFCFTSLFEH